MILFKNLLLLFIASSLCAQSFLRIIQSQPSRVFSGSLDEPVNQTEFFGVQAPSSNPTGNNVKFKYVGIQHTFPSPPRPDTPNFIIITPATGLAPDSVSRSMQGAVSVNEQVVQRMRPGLYLLDAKFSTVDQSPQTTAVLNVGLRLLPPPAPAIASVVNSASFQPSLTAGALVTIFGTHLAPNLGVQMTDDTGAYPLSLGDGSAEENTTVTFDGIPAPILYASQNQLNLAIPFGVAGKSFAQLVLTRFSATAKIIVPLSAAAPAVFTATGTGFGQGAIINVPGGAASSLNSSSNPIRRGGAITFWFTGAGELKPAAPDGTINLIPSFVLQPPLYSNLTLPVSLTVGDRPAAVIYSGSSSYLTSNIVQINAVLAEDTPVGNQPLVLNVGGLSNSAQNVTVAVK